MFPDPRDACSDAQRVGLWLLRAGVAAGLLCLAAGGRAAASESVEPSDAAAQLLLALLVCQPARGLHHRLHQLWGHPRLNQGNLYLEWRVAQPQQGLSTLHQLGLGAVRQRAGQLCGRGWCGRGWGLGQRRSMNVFRGRR